MSFGRFSSDSPLPMAEINTTPLVDVMLVLLVVFMVTTPLMTQSFSVELPGVNGKPDTDTQEVIDIEIKQNGNLSWNRKDITLQEIKTELRKVSELEKPPEIYVLADKSVRYEHIANVMGAAKVAGVKSIGFKMLVEN